MKRFDTVIGTDLSAAKQHLENGEAIGLPTETVYGLAANALKAEAVLKIFAIKERPSFDPLIVHIPSVDHVERYAMGLPEAGRKLADAFWPGPLTMLLPRKECVPDEVTSGLPRVALRVPGHKLARALLEQLPFPLAAPSANPFGYVSPTTPEHVVAQLGGKLPYVLDGGACPVGVESTIVGFDEDGLVVVHRLGGIAVEKLVEVVGEQALRVDVVLSSDPSKPKAPGMLKSHYAPSKPLVVVEAGADIDCETRKTGVISVVKRDGLKAHLQLSLCPSGVVDCNEAARHVFATLRAMDASDVECIYAEKCPDAGLGRAVNDRLSRASTKRD